MIGLFLLGLVSVGVPATSGLILIGTFESAIRNRTAEAADIWIWPVVGALHVAAAGCSFALLMRAA